MILNQQRCAVFLCCGNIYTVATECNLDNMCSYCNKILVPAGHYEPPLYLWTSRNLLIVQSLDVTVASDEAEESKN